MRKTFRIGNRYLTLPVLEVSLWEESDGEGFVIDEGYTYYTPYGRVITRITGHGEVVLHARLDWERIRKEVEI